MRIRGDDERRQPLSADTLEPSKMAAPSRSSPRRATPGGPAKLSDGLAFVSEGGVFQARAPSG
jgi:hypothetical protein